MSVFDKLLLDLEFEGEKVEQETLNKTKGSNSLFLRGFNFATKGLKELEACYTIQCDQFKRTLVVSAEWDMVNDTTSPKDIVIEYVTDESTYVRTAVRSVSEYAEIAHQLPRADAFHLQIGLMRHTGWCNLEDIERALTNCFGRNVESMKAFLSGRNDYEKIDSTYEQSWATW